jgi:uncharacterized protein
MSVAVAIVCKTPTPGKSKTRLSPPLQPEECAEISSCFIQDLANTISNLVAEGVATGHALYTPHGSEDALRRLLPAGFGLTAQADGDLGARLLQGTIDLLANGHEGVILVNSDSPTLPLSILRDAVAAVRRENCVVLSPAFDGGYTLIGLSTAHARLFDGIPWSTSDVYQLTLARAQAIGLPVALVPGWYDVDDAASLDMLEKDLTGHPPLQSHLRGADAPATRRFLRNRGAPFGMLGTPPDVRS